MRVLLPERVGQVDFRRGLIWGFDAEEEFFMCILICVYSYKLPIFPRSKDEAKGEV